MKYLNKKIIIIWIAFVVLLPNLVLALDLEKMKGIDDLLKDKNAYYAPSKGIIYIKGHILKNMTKFSASQPSKEIRNFIDLLYNAEEDQRITELSRFPGKFLHPRLIGQIMGELEKDHDLDIDEENKLKNGIENLVVNSLQKDFKYKGIQGKEKAALLLVRKEINAYKSERMKSDPNNLKASKAEKTKLNEEFENEIRQDANIKQKIVDEVYNQLVDQNIKDELKKKLIDLILGDEVYSKELKLSEAKYDELSKLAKDSPNKKEVYERELTFNDSKQHMRNLELFAKRLTELPKEKTYPILTSMLYEKSRNTPNKAKYLEFYKGMNDVNKKLINKLPQDENEWIDREFMDEDIKDSFNSQDDKALQIYNILKIKDSAGKVKTFDYERLSDVPQNPGDCGEASLRSFFHLLTTNKEGKRDTSILEKIAKQTNHNMDELIKYFNKYETYEDLKDKEGSQEKRLDWFMFLSDLNNKHPDQDKNNEVDYRKKYLGQACELGAKNGSIPNMLNVIKKLTGVKSWEELNKVIANARDDKFKLEVPDSEKYGYIQVKTSMLGDYKWELSDYHYVLNAISHDSIPYDQEDLADIDLSSFYPFNYSNFEFVKDKKGESENPFHYLGAVTRDNIFGYSYDLNKLGKNQILDLYGALDTNEDKVRFFDRLNAKSIDLFEKEMIKLVSSDVISETIAEHLMGDYLYNNNSRIKENIYAKTKELAKVNDYYSKILLEFMSKNKDDSKSPQLFEEYVKNTKFKPYHLRKLEKILLEQDIWGKDKNVGLLVEKLFDKMQDYFIGEIIISGKYDKHPDFSKWPTMLIKNDYLRSVGPWELHKILGKIFSMPNKLNSFKKDIILNLKDYRFRDPQSNLLKWMLKFMKEEKVRNDSQYNDLVKVLINNKGSQNADLIYKNIGNYLNKANLELLIDMKPSLLNEMVNNNQHEETFKNDFGLLKKFIGLGNASKDVIYNKFLKNPTETTQNGIKDLISESNVQVNNEIEVDQLREIINWTKEKNAFLQNITCGDLGFAYSASKLREYAQNNSCLVGSNIQKLIKYLSENSIDHNNKFDVDIENTRYVVKKLSGGEHGLVYEVQKPGEKVKVLKIVQFTKEGEIVNEPREHYPPVSSVSRYMHEVNDEEYKEEKIEDLKDFFIAQDLAKNGHPIIEETCSVGKYGAVIMKKGTPYEIEPLKVNTNFKASAQLFKDQICSLKELHAKNIIHGDPHLGNLINYDGQASFIDFGNSYSTKPFYASTSYREDIQFEGSIGDRPMREISIGKDYYAVGINMVRLILGERIPKNYNEEDYLNKGCLGKFTDIDADPEVWNKTIQFNDDEDSPCYGQPYLTPTSLVGDLLENDPSLEEDRAQYLSKLIYQMISTHSDYWPTEEEINHFIGQCK